MKKGYLLVLMTALISGVSIFVNKFGISMNSPASFVFLKNLTVGLLLVGIIVGLKRFKELKALRTKQWLKLSVVGLIGGSIPFIMFFSGLKLGEPAMASFLHKSLFVFVLGISLFLGRKMSWKVPVFGLLILVGNALLLKVAKFSFGYGEMLILGAVILWASEVVYSKHLMKDLSSEVVAFGRMFFGAVFVGAYLLVTGNTVAITLQGAGWIMITSLFLLGYVFTFYKGLSYISPIEATTILTLGAPITFLLSIVTGSVFSIVQLLGVGAIVSGIILVRPQQQNQDVC